MSAVETSDLIGRVQRLQQQSMVLGGAGPLVPREYQSEAIDAVLHLYHEEQVRRMLGVAATGLGKTVIFAHLANRLQVDTLVVAHRDELLDQAADKIATVWPEAEIGKVKGNSDDRHAQVVVGSVQTLSRESRLQRIDPKRFGLVVIDEAHHAASASYRRILDALDPDCLVVGVTATPDRADGVGLHNVFDQIAFTYDMLWGIKAGYLSDLRGLTVELDVDLSSVKRRGGDYVDGDLGRALHDANAPAHVVKAWQEHASDRQRTLIFCPTVDLSREMQAAFTAAGIDCGHVDGAMKTYERRQVLHDFHHGHTRVLTNCAVLTEGYDEPAIDCVVVARPTESRSLYVQMVGRGTRKYPGKDDCLIIDAVGVAAKQTLVMLPTLFGLSLSRLKRKMDGEALTEAGAFDSLSVLEGAAQQEALDIEAGRVIAREVDLFQRLDTGRLAWVSAGEGRFVISVETGFVALIPLADERWRVVKRAKGKNSTGERWPFRVIADDVDLQMAQGIGEDYVRKNARDSLGIASKTAAWRTRPVGETQAETMRKMRLPIGEDMTAGQASDAISAKIAARELRGYQP